jgi:hypothetical protein
MDLYKYNFYHSYLSHEMYKDHQLLTGLLQMQAKDSFTPSSGLPRVGLRASRALPGASLKAATGQGRWPLSVSVKLRLLGYALGIESSVRPGRFVRFTQWTHNECIIFYN